MMLSHVVLCEAIWFGKVKDECDLDLLLFAWLLAMQVLKWKMKKGGVMQLRHARGCHMVFWKPIQPLQRVPRLACSVASLS